jgi:TRAP-type C4-dicarboxylate transport system substrate-binding protein
MTELNWALLLGATVIKKDVWERIPADLRPKLLQIQHDAAKKLQADIRQSAERDIQSMKAAGLKVVSVDARALRQWQASVDAAKNSIRGEFVPAEAYDEALRFRDEYRKQHANGKQ